MVAFRKSPHWVLCVLAPLFLLLLLRTPQISNITPILQKRKLAFLKKMTLGVDFGGPLPGFESQSPIY